MNTAKTFIAKTFALLVLMSGLALAQNALGRISGSVRDQTSAVVSGAKITVTNEGTGQQVFTITSNAEGAFVVPQLSPGSYTVKIEASGFKTGSYNQVKVEPGLEYSLVATLEVGATSELVQITAGSDLVNTSSPEITNTVIRRQIVDLPLNGRNPIELIRLQAGVVGLPTRTSTTINGGRPTWTQITKDGINIQDNFIRTNSLDFVPNRPTTDTISEFTITTNTQGADAAGGASQVKLVTPSGTNEFHGTLYEFNRNSALGANTWFNNATVDTRTGKTLPRPFLNRNQFGGNIAGPVLAPKKVFGPLGGWNDNKNKLFFSFSYEGFRQRTQVTQNNTVPVRDNLLDGVFSYVRPSDSTVQTINVLGVRPGITLDSKVKSLLLSRFPSSSVANNFDVGNSTSARLLNTAGFRFLQSDVNDRNQYEFRFDFKPTEKHSFEFVHQRFKETDDRTDLDAINKRPKVFTSADTKFLVGAWRWSATSKLNNELRIGANLAPVAFENGEDFIGTIFPTALGLTNREVQFQPQGRDTRTFQFIDNASYIAGDHSMQFGGSLQKIKVRPYNFGGRFPTVTFGFSAASPAAVQLTQADFPGSSISAQDLANANALRAFLGGVVSQVTQTFQVKDKNSGFVPGIPEERNFTLNNWAYYFQDGWRIKPNLTLRLGLKWEYFSPLREDNNLQLLPVLSGRSSDQAIVDPNVKIDFANGNYYNKDLNNFAPSIGLAWDPFKDGKTSIRAGYTKAFVNEETITVGRNAGIGNPGLTTTLALVNQYTFVNGANFGITAPTPLVPRTLTDQLGVSPQSAVFGIDQNIKQPFVHQFSFSVEREIGWDIAVEGRYVSTLGRDIWRGLDLNQTNAAINQPFFNDFLRARNNGYLALNTPSNTPGCAAGACGVFNPAFNANIVGSQQLTVIPNFGGGSLANANVRAAIQTGQVGSLADFYTNGNAGTAVAQQARAFFYNPGNPGIYAADLVLNGGETDYHSFQGEVRRRFKGGIFGQMNYTFSKVLSNSPGTTQARFEPFIDNARQGLEKTRADFDVTHVVNASVIFEMPFGKGKKFLNGAGKFADRVIGGWQVNSIVHAQSGAPISIISGRGTFNRAGRSGGNPAFSSLTREQISNLFGIRKLPDGRVFYIDPAVTDPNGRAVGADNLGNTAGFAGQVFFHPSAGQIGTLQRLQFDGPSQTSWDFGILKRTRISETKNLEIRADFFNFLNHPLFFVGDSNIDGTQFGRITGLNFGPRVVQVSGRFSF
ncbi:MAG: TonB-dependent receptor domain-containing protein [Blastocatellia bacterium]